MIFKKKVILIVFQNLINLMNILTSKINADNITSFQKDDNV